MELSTGNLVSIQATEENTLRIVAAAIQRGGPDSVRTLALAYNDDSG